MFLSVCMRILCVCVCMCVHVHVCMYIVYTRVRERVAVSSRTKRVNVCEECKVRGRRGSKRAYRALQHSRWKKNYV